MQTFNDILMWLSGSSGGSFILIAWLVAWLFEDFAWWNNLAGKIKILIILGASGILGASAVALQSNPALVASIDPYFRPFMYVVMAWLATQTSHKADKALSK